MSDFENIPVSELPFNKLDVTYVSSHHDDFKADLKVTGVLAEVVHSDALITSLVEVTGFKAGPGEVAHSVTSSGVVGLLGFGKKISASASHHIFQKIGTGLATLASTCKSTRMTVTFPCEISKKIATTIFEQFFFDLYVDNRFKAEKKQPKLAHLEIVSKNTSEMRSAFEMASKLACGTFFARDLINAPANYCHPESMSKLVSEEASRLGLQVTVFDREECEKRGMGSFIAVGKGSVHQPKFVHATYTPEGEIKKKLVFIGKGVTFDTGGYNIKLAMMESMIFDMGGAGAVFGAMRAIAHIKPANVEIHFISALADNAISHNAYRPGDILTASNGKTIEVLNTDAEGRLTMADALVYAEKNIKPDAIVELSTLTGAQLVALGLRVAALMSKNEGLTKCIESSSKATGDLLWRMPLFDEYKEGIKSKRADLANLDNSRWAGSISAGLFLNEFVEKTPFAHIDMAGPVWNAKAGTATGFGVKLLVDIANTFATQEVDLSVDEE